jgi:ABC-2 type transport system permease protein
VINPIRAELLKLRSMPGVWVIFLIVFPLTVLAVTLILVSAGFSGHTFFFVHTLNQERELLGAGYAPMQVLAPILGVLCITTEYRNKTITSTLLLTPRRSRVLGAKIVVTAYWAVLMTLLSLVVVLAIGLPWNAGLGGSTSALVDQFGAVIPGLFAAAILLALFGLGFGTLVKNQVAGILLTIGGTFILEGLLVVLAHSVFHYDLNWLPTSASAALAGTISRGGFGGRGGGAESAALLAWWQGGLVMLGWGLVPLTIGYYTTFRKDVT